MTATADYTEKIVLIPALNGICGNYFTTTTTTSGYAS